MATLGFVGFLILVVCICIIAGLGALFVGFRNWLWGGRPESPQGGWDD